MPVSCEVSQPERSLLDAVASSNIFVMSVRVCDSRGVPAREVDVERYSFIEHLYHICDLRGARCPSSKRCC